MKMENELFRKSPLEKISSPEQLNDYIKVTSISSWVVVAGLFVFFAGAVYWGLAGSIPETVKVQGVAFAKVPGAEEVYCFIPLGSAQRLQTGMAVQVSPEYAPRAEYGYIYGQIESIGEAPVTDQQIIETFGSLEFVEGLLVKGNLLQVKIALKRQAGSLAWSSAKGQEVALPGGSHCEVLVITKERKPYELILGR
jgi:hypothetical protein